MTSSKAVISGQPALDQVLADVFGLDNWAALMRRYVSAPKQQVTVDNLNDAQPNDIGLVRADPAWLAAPRRYRGDLRS